MAFDPTDPQVINLQSQRDDALARIATADADKAAAVAAQLATDQALAATVTEKAAIDQANAISAATGPLEAQIETLTGQAATLQTQLSGSAGQYQITLTPTQLALLSIQAAQQQTTVAAILNSFTYAALNAEALLPANQQAIFGAAMAKFPTLSPTTQGQILTALGLGGFAGLAPDALALVLENMGLPFFLALPSDTQNTVMHLLAIGV